jgi:large subunit ribosomal protein L17
MRHGKKFNHLGRTASHRSAMLSNMASSLILHKRINTTVAKAKALRKYIEPMITRSKDDSTHSRRMVFSYLQNKESVTELFSTVAEKVNARPGGYTRIIKTGIRQGDNAEMCMMELVDFNELLLGTADAGKAKTRRSRRGGTGKSEDLANVPAAEVVETEIETAPESVVEEADVVEEGIEEEVVAATDVDVETNSDEEKPESDTEDTEDTEEKK